MQLGRKFGPIVACELRKPKETRNRFVALCPGFGLGSLAAFSGNILVRLGRRSHRSDASHRLLVVATSKMSVLRVISALGEDSAWRKRLSLQSRLPKLGVPECSLLAQSKHPSLHSICDIAEMS